MKALTTALSAAAVLALAACGASSPPAAPATTPPATTPAAAHAPAPSPQASQDARLLVGDIATSSSSGTMAALSVVAGPVMTAYVTLQAIEAEASEAAGQPYPAESVTAIGGGYQLCLPQGQCDSFTAFQTDAAGRVTGADVDGQPIAARLATGPSDHANGLVLTDVTSYLSTSVGKVAVVFHVRNESNSGVTTDGFLPLFVTSDGNRLQPDLSESSPNSDAGSLGAGQTEALVVVFDTRSFTGTFILQNNGAYQDLVTSRLSKPAS